ncbi:MAG TPA: DMT family transporter [Bacteroidia bacterium]|jgi:drug/metabolite transporter (DMT)-like permease
MQTRVKTTNFLLLHFIVFIWGWTAVLGKIITLPFIKLVWIRVFIAMFGMLVYALAKGASLKVPGRSLTRFIGIGIIVGIHWICFYGAVKLSNVSVTLACFSTGTLFTAFIEPVFFKRRILWYEIFFGLVVIGALLMIFNVETQYKMGMALGVGAALTSSLMAVLNGMMMKQEVEENEEMPRVIDAEKKKIKSAHDPAVMSFYEMIGCAFCLSVALIATEPFTGDFFNVSSHDWFYIFVLAICCTTVPFVIGVQILKEISPYTVSLTLNLETIYGILFAFFIFRDSETMSFTFYAGALIILSTIFANAALKSYLRK